MIKPVTREVQIQVDPVCTTGENVKPISSSLSLAGTTIEEKLALKKQFDNPP